MSTTIIDKAINMAVQNLNAAGCRYFIIKPDGTELGDRTLLEPEKGRRKYGPRVHNFKATGYMERIDKMAVGSVEVFEAPEGATPEAYRKVIAARGFAKFGRGNFMTTITEGRIEAMRTGGAP